MLHVSSKNLHLLSIRIDLCIPNIPKLFEWNKFRTRCCSTNSPCIPRNANLTRFSFIRSNERNRVEEKVQFRKVYPKWRNYAWGRMPARPWGFPRNLASWGTNIVLTGPPGSYSCAAGSIADCRNALPLAFNVQLGDYFPEIRPWRLGKNRDRNRASVRCDEAHYRTSAGVISNITWTKSSKSIVTIMRAA